MGRPAGETTALCFAVNGIVQLITGGQIRMAYIVFAGVALVNVVLVLLIDEHKYNRDWKAAPAVETVKKAASVPMTGRKIV